MSSIICVVKGTPLTCFYDLFYILTIEGYVCQNETLKYAQCRRHRVIFEKQYQLFNSPWVVLHYLYK